MMTSDEAAALRRGNSCEAVYCYAAGVEMLLKIVLAQVPLLWKSEPSAWILGSSWQDWKC
jgi:hypothetical protein